MLEGKNLRVVSKEESKTKSEGYQLAMTYKTLEKQEGVIKKTLRLLHKIQKNPDWTSLKHHLARRYPLIYRQFLRDDEEGFTTVGREPFDAWMSERLPVAPEELQDVSLASGSTDEILNRAKKNAHAVLPDDRKRLLALWAEEIRVDAINDLFESVKAATKFQRQLTDVHDDVDRRVLQTADVIGVTTTGLARRIATLQHVKCKVVMCEEAGEVLEAHMLSALLPSVEHFIQIGDHQQLRPQINNYSCRWRASKGLCTNWTAVNSSALLLETREVLASRWLN